MASSTDAEKDTKLAALVKTMHERVPKEKRLTADVIMQLLKSKYTAMFPEEYLSLKGEFIASLIHSLYAGGTISSTTSAPNGAPKETAVPDGSSTDDADEDEEEEDEEDGEEGEDEESGEESEEDEEDDEFGSDDDDDSEEERDEPKGAEPAEKRQRLEGHSAPRDGGEPAQGCVDMAACLRKLGYRPRRQEAGESSETYTQQYLVPLFREKGLDPERYSRADVRRYMVLKELEQLKADGADINLDRSMRSGRGFNNTPLEGSTVKLKTSNFLDDDE